MPPVCSGALAIAVPSGFNNPIAIFLAIFIGVGIEPAIAFKLSISFLNSGLVAWNLKESPIPMPVVSFLSCALL